MHSQFWNLFIAQHDFHKYKIFGIAEKCSRSTRMELVITISFDSHHFIGMISAFGTLLALLNYCLKIQKSLFTWCVKQPLFSYQFRYQFLLTFACLHFLSKAHKTHSFSSCFRCSFHFSS